MAKTRVGTLNVLLTASTKRFNSAMDAAQKRIRSFGSAILRVGKRVAAFGGVPLPVSVLPVWFYW